MAVMPLIARLVGSFRLPPWASAPRFMANLPCSSVCLAFVLFGTMITYAFLRPLQFIAYWAFYLPTWEEYHTGVLYLGYLNGPTEGLIGAIILIIASGIFGKLMFILC